MRGVLGLKDLWADCEADLAARIREGDGEGGPGGPGRGLHAPGPHHGVPAVGDAHGEDSCRVHTAGVGVRVQDAVAGHRDDEEDERDDGAGQSGVVIDEACHGDDSDGQDGGRDVEELTLCD